MSSRLTLCECEGDAYTVCSGTRILVHDGVGFGDCRVWVLSDKDKTKKKQAIYHLEKKAIDHGSA